MADVPWSFDDYESPSLEGMLRDLNTIGDNHNRRYRALIMELQEFMEMCRGSKSQGFTLRYILADAYDHELGRVAGIVTACTGVIQDTKESIEAVELGILVPGFLLDTQQVWLSLMDTKAMWVESALEALMPPDELDDHRPPKKLSRFVSSMNFAGIIRLSTPIQPT
jgi:hypothetical protein